MLIGIVDQPDPATSKAPWRIYNIGNNKPVQLMDYIDALEKTLGKKAKINFLPLQPGDVPDTYANVDNLKKNLIINPQHQLLVEYRILLNGTKIILEYDKLK